MVPQECWRDTTKPVAYGHYESVADVSQQRRAVWGGKVFRQQISRQEISLPRVTVELGSVHQMFLSRFNRAD